MGVINGEWLAHAGARPSPEFDRQARFIRASVGEDHKRRMADWLASTASDGWNAEHLLQRAREM